MNIQLSKLKNPNQGQKKASQLMPTGAELNQPRLSVERRRFPLSTISGQITSQS